MYTKEINNNENRDSALEMAMPISQESEQMDK